MTSIDFQIDRAAQSLKRSIFRIDSHLTKLRKKYNDMRHQQDLRAAQRRTRVQEDYQKWLLERHKQARETQNTTKKKRSTRKKNNARKHRIVTKEKTKKPATRARNTAS